jgi:DNA-binding response OmpR family regulator
MPNKKRILVVDDEPGILNFVCTRLETAGYEVVAAVDGEEGLLEARTGHFDLILLDLFMVPTSGFVVLDRLRSFSNVPVIIFSAHSYLIEKAFRLGANDFLAKPFDPDVLIAKINRLVSPKAPRLAEKRPRDGRSFEGSTPSSLAGGSRQS